MSSHWKDLLVWQRSHDFVLTIYKLIATFPQEERFHLIDQIKRAASSVPANIVEGHSRQSKKEFVRFMMYSRGSLEELRYFILLAKDLKYIEEIRYKELEERAVEISYLLNSLIKSMK